jgi:hypothetical protein
MVTTSDAGLDYYRDSVLGSVGGELDTIAVGVGSDPESTTDASLTQRVYASSGIDVDFIDGTAPGEYAGIIEITGGDQIPAGTTITEMNVIVGAIGLPLARDVFNGTTLNASYTEEFEMPIDLERA